MKALILNSGIGKRMGDITEKHPKCMTPLTEDDTILSKQLRALSDLGIEDVVITTGPFEQNLKDYCDSLNLNLNYVFINNPKYDSTNYIYSIFLAKDYLDDDIILMHGDLVFDINVLYNIVNQINSCMVISSTTPLPQKDFKAVIQKEENEKIVKVGIEFFDDAVTAQPLYKLNKEDWRIWLTNIESYCSSGNNSCYAENALNEVATQCNIIPYDIKDRLCSEIDTMEDLNIMRDKLKNNKDKIVYVCFSTDIIHGGHINIIEKASKFGKVVIGLLSDEAVASYKRFPMLSYNERKNIIQHINGVSEVVEQKQLSYAENLLTIRPDYVVHGDDWRTGFQAPIRDEVIAVLEQYGGELIEIPYSNNEDYKKLEEQFRNQLSIPDIRRGRLKKLLSMKKAVTAIEAHNGITGLIAEKTTVLQNGRTYQFDAMWVSSLCDSIAKGKPDIELVDMSSRIRTIDDIMEVTTKPIILDGDTGGLTEHFVYNVRTLERMGVSAVIIEDKTGLKKNSLFGNDVEQTQDTIENFCQKISAGKKAQKTKEFMIIARIESLILEKGMEDALTRAYAYVNAGADGIMIHSRKKDPAEIFEFVEKFRMKEPYIPVIVVPTSFNTVTEEEFAEKGINLIIYANQLTRCGVPAMEKAAQTILEHHRAKETDDMCMSINSILNLIPEEY